MGLGIMDRLGPLGKYECDIPENPDSPTQLDSARVPSLARGVAQHPGSGGTISGLKGNRPSPVG